MKTALAIGLFICFSLPIFSQISAVTNKGDKVVLFNDGTWEYEDKKIFSWESIKHNKKKFKNDLAADFLVESSKVDVGVWLDAKKWKFEKSGDDEESEFGFQLKNEDLYAMLITEKIQIPLETLQGIVLENAKSVAPNAKFVEQEFRNVNGQEVLMLQMRGRVQGIDFVYFGYYFSDQNGTVQLLTYTAQNMFDTYKSQIENFLNGFVVLK